MAAPSHTALVIPTGIMIPDGFKTTVAFSTASGVNLWPKDVTPPGVEGGGGIPVDTMLNTLYRIKRAKKLVSIDDISFDAGWDPSSYNIYVNICNKEGSCTVYLPDGSYGDFYGYLNSFKPGRHSEGAFPLAACMLVITNWDPVGHLEVGPVWVGTGGT